MCSIFFCLFFVFLFLPLIWACFRQILLPQKEMKTSFFYTNFKICLLLLVEKVSWSKNFTKINKIWIWIICLSVISLFSISISTVWVHFAYFDTNCLFCFFLLVFLFSNFLWIFEIFFDYFWLWQLFEKCLFW